MLPRTLTDGRAARLNLDELEACIFDLDGVLTDTASLHRQAWQVTFDELFARLGQASTPAFTDEDYLRLVDGKLRLDGVRAVVADRHLDLPEGDNDDGPDDLTISGIGALKDERYRNLLDRVGPSPYESSLVLLQRVRTAGLRTAVITGSLHCKEVLRLAGIEEFFDAVVDGNVAAAMKLPGKPAPDTLLEAASRLGARVCRTVVIDDAFAGVQAGVAGGFFVIGVERGTASDDLANAGPHIVVSDLSEIELVGNGPAGDCYRLSDPDDALEREGTRETLFTLSNGYIGTRGARPYVHNDGVHYPGTYFAGVYNRFSATVMERSIEEEVIVNAPNWLSFSFSVDGGPWLGSDDLTVTSRSLELDLRRGLLERRFVVDDRDGRQTSVFERRFVSMANPHLAAIEVQVVAENWSGRLEIRAALDGAVIDSETVEERLLGGRHVELVEATDDPPDGAVLVVRTLQSGVVLAEAMRARVSNASGSRFDGSSTSVARHFAVPMTIGARVTCEKVVAFHSSRDMAISEPVGAARDAAQAADSFEALLAMHEESWSRLWATAAVEIRDDTSAAQQLVNLHLFHVLQVASPNVIDHDVGLGARGLHGEGYLGHVFWDELFVFPILVLRFPSLARSLLAYRSRRLETAKSLARAEGRRGARFPWQSGSDGRDETPEILYNPRSDHWIADRSRFQRHVGLAVAYNFSQYFEATGDLQHLFDTGAEVIFEVARYFASLTRFDAALGRYRIERVMGPDEFHDGYPWRQDEGVDDNAYTNVMTAWLLGRALGIAELARQSGREDVLERIKLRESELEEFEDISHRLYVPFIGNVLEQFDNYDRLLPLDLDSYRERYGDIGLLDLILEAEGDDVRRYQVAKQADVLMLLYLFSAEELRIVLARLGYEFDADAIRATIDFYSSRVTHGSSLSRIVYAWVSARLDRTSSWRYLSDALATDFADAHRGTTREGIHLGAMAGTIDVFTRCYTGLEVRSDALWLNPQLPEEIDSLAFHVDYRGHLLSISIDRHAIEILCPRGPAAPVTLLLRGTPYTVHAGDQVTQELAN